MPRQGFSAEELLPDPFEYLGRAASLFLVFSGIVLSSLGLLDFVDPTYWTISAVLAILLSYSLRRYISHRYLTILITCSALILLTVWSAVEVKFFDNFYITDQQNVERNVKEFVVLFFIAVLMTIPMISYRRSFENMTTPIPSDIAKVFRENYVEPKFFYQNFDCDVILDRDRQTESVIVEMSIEFLVVNISGSEQEIVSRYPKISDEFKLRSISIDGDLIDLDNPALHRDDAVIVTSKVPPKIGRTIAVKLNKRFSTRDSELFTAYDFPARKFTFKATIAADAGLEVWAELLTRQAILPKRTGSVLQWDPGEPVMPFQGLRLLWKPKK